MKILTISFLLMVSTLTMSQNCLHLKSIGDTIQYEACQIGESAEFYYQFTKEYQQIYDSAIETCPYFATAYHAKSVAYLKSGNFIEWKKLIDKAVDLDPKEYLGYRASCRFQFVHDYKGTIKDLEKLNKLVDYDIGYTSDGEYHLDIVRAICYKQLGNHKKAVNLINSKLAEKNYQVELFDYYHLGITYLNVGLYQEAIDSFNEQIIQNKSAEVYYYLALAYKRIKDIENYKTNIHLAKDLYNKGNIMTGSYTEYLDKIYLNDINKEIENGL